MGKSSSKEENHNGDSQVTVVQMQHSEYHESHEWKLWAILIVTTAQLMVTLYKIHAKKMKKRHLKAAVSFIDVNKV